MSGVDRIGSVCRVCARFLDNPGQEPDWSREVMSFLKDTFLARHHSTVRWYQAVPTTTVWLDDTPHKCDMCGTEHDYLFPVEVAS